MYTVSVQAHYDAAHFLRNYEGKCQQLHGHRYVVEAAVSVATVGDAGIAFDFVDLKRELRELANTLDHQNINEIPPFTEIESSAENQARYFYEGLERRLPPEIGDGLLYTRVWETPTQWALYSTKSIAHPLPQAQPSGSPSGNPAA